MSLEKKLKIKKFTNEWHKATLHILYTNNWMVLELEKRAHRRDITLQQFNVLRILERQYPKPITNTMIKERMVTNTPDISRLVDRIVAKQLVSRTQNEADKRSVDLTITDAGIKLLQEIEDEMLLIDILKPNINEDECSKLSDLLTKFRGEKIL